MIWNKTFKSYSIFFQKQLSYLFKLLHKLLENKNENWKDKEENCFFCRQTLSNKDDKLDFATHDFVILAIKLKIRKKSISKLLSV